MKKKANKFYPFSAELTRKLKKLRLYSKAVKAYDRLKKCYRGDGNCEEITGCFIFSATKEGIRYWYDVDKKLQNLK